MNPEPSEPIVKPSTLPRVSWLRSVWSGLRTLSICYVGVVLVLMLLENSLVYHPVAANSDWQPPPCAEIEDVTLTCADKTCLHAWWLPCPDTKSAVLYLHGNAGNLSHRGKSVVKLRELLGASVLIVDYPGYGRSEGRPSEAGCYQAAEAAYEWLTREQGVAAKDLIIYGKSLGGAVAVDLASRREHRALVLIKTFTSAPDVGSSAFPWLPVRWIMRNRFASIDKIAACQRPVFFAHGDADEIVSFSLGQRLFDAANDPKQFFVLPGSQHNDPISDAMFKSLAAFLELHAPAGTSAVRAVD